MPLIFFPFVLSALSDALVALTRISGFLTAEELPEPHKIEYGRATAVEVDGDFTWETVPSALVQAAHAGFGGMRGRSGVVRGGGRGGGGRVGRSGRSKIKDGNGNGQGGDGRHKSWWKFRSKKEATAEVLPVSKKAGDESEDEGVDTKKASLEKEKEKEDEKPFELRGLRMVVPKGAFVGVVGRVGSGKVTLLPHRKLE